MLASRKEDAFSRGLAMQTFWDCSDSSVTLNSDSFLLEFQQLCFNKEIGALVKDFGKW